MSKFIELSSKEQEQVNGGGLSSVLDAFTDWLAGVLGLYDEGSGPLIPY